MEIGIGLPNTLDIAGPVIADWARRAEQRGFSTLTTIDRIVYPTYDSLTTLAVAAGATERIGLFPDILLAPAVQPDLAREGDREPASDVRGTADARSRRRWPAGRLRGDAAGLRRDEAA